MKDFLHPIYVAHLLDAKNITDHTDIGSDYVDMAGFEQVAVLVNFGAVTTIDTSNKVIPVLQECDTLPGTNTSWTDVAAGDILGAFTAVDGASDDQATQRVCYIGDARYLRVKLDFTSAGAQPDTCNVSIDVILASPRHGMAADQTVITAVSTA
jgi:hypothetical protein